MWTRRELKERGKKAFKAHYWKCVLVALILGIVIGTGTGFSGSFGVPGMGDHEIFGFDEDDFKYGHSGKHKPGDDYYVEEDDDDDDDDAIVDTDKDDDDEDADNATVSDADVQITGDGDSFKVNVKSDGETFSFDMSGEGININGDEVTIDPSSISVHTDDDDVDVQVDGDTIIINGKKFTPDDFEEDIKETIRANKAPFIAMGIAFFVVFLVVFVIVMAFVIALDILIFNPIEMGCQRFFRKNADDTSKLSNIVFAFDHNYKNTVKIMFFRDLYITLWSLLFVIPGIIKSYEYRMIPYILGDNPTISKAEAFRLSKEMMAGNKWRAFVLDLSFIGWDLLSVLTCGILSIFFVDPYKYATDAELYLALKGDDVETFESETVPAGPVVEVDTTDYDDSKSDDTEQ